MKTTPLYIIHNAKLQKEILKWTNDYSERVKNTFGEQKFLQRQNLKDQLKTLYHPGQYGAILMVHILTQRGLFYKVFFTVGGRRMVYFTYLKPGNDEFEAECVLFQLIQTRNQLKSKFKETESLLREMELELKRHIKLNPKYDVDPRNIPIISFLTCV